MLKIVLQNASENSWLVFKKPEKLFIVKNIDQVTDSLREIESLVNTKNLWAAGYIAYEASPAFDSHYTVKKKIDYPFLIFGLFHKPIVFKDIPFDGRKTYSFTEWLPGIDKQTYDIAISKIKHQIKLGNTYQVNYTFPLYSTFTGSFDSLFYNMVRSQQCQYAAMIETNDLVICSSSPELFFELNGNTLLSKPMKGTAPRGKYPLKDLQLKRELQHSIKDRAENVMIVDMVRNDMGHIADFGSVTVPHLYSIEQYPTLWQMTSTVKSNTNASITDIFKALFPCSSITGAPKVSTMQIIDRLEKAPRGIYTGSIGFLAPDRKAQFNVAIRTLIQNKNTGKAVYNIGSGIVWDSKTDSEYRECLLKADVLNHKHIPFKLLETLLWQQNQGYFILDLHLERLRRSARYFGFKINLLSIKNNLDQKASSFDQDMRVRLLVNHDGKIEIQSFQLETQKNKLARIRLADHPVNSSSVWLYHKTTNRIIYDQLLAEHMDCDDVILWNEKNEITEGCRNNIVIKINNDLFTPPVSCGLLGGTFREYLLKTKEIKEKTITRNDFNKANEIYLINSVRKWRKCEII